MAAPANYNLSLTYRNGKLDQDADGLSRLPDVQDAQQIDPDILKAILDLSQVDRGELLLADNLLVCIYMFIMYACLFLYTT